MHLTFKKINLSWKKARGKKNYSGAKDNNVYGGFKTCWMMINGRPFNDGIDILYVYGVNSLPNHEPLCQIMLQVTDLDRAVSFYEEVKLDFQPFNSSVSHS